MSKKRSEWLVAQGYNNIKKKDYWFTSDGFRQEKGNISSTKLDPLVSEKFGEYDRAWHVYVFDGKARLRDLYNYAREQGIPLRGTSLPPSAYDCTGRWWCEPISVSKVGGLWVCALRMYCDV